MSESSESVELTRGEFARRSGLSPKALRLYERSGLLVPHRVEAANGYRFYLPGQVGVAVRSGEVEGRGFGVDPELPMLRGGWLVRDYVWLEVAHRLGVETLLWDGWGAMGRWGESALTDEVAGLVVAADAGDGGAEEELARRFVGDGRLAPGGRVYCASPSGYRGWVDLGSRVGEPRL